MKLYWIELLDSQVPLALRRRGLLQLSGLALVVQLFHLGLAWLALPEVAGLPLWLVWAVSSFLPCCCWLSGCFIFAQKSASPGSSPQERLF